MPPEQSSELVEALKARGVTARRRPSWSRRIPASRIQTKIEVFDWLLRNEDKRVGKNPAGYLVASIRADYQAPEQLRRSRRRGQGPGGRAVGR